MPWSKYDHLNLYNFLIAVQDKGLDDDAITYIRNLGSKVEELETEIEELIAARTDYEYKVEQLHCDLAYLEEEIKELKDQIKSLESQLGEQNAA